MSSAQQPDHALNFLHHLIAGLSAEGKKVFIEAYVKTDAALRPQNELIDQFFSQAASDQTLSVQSNELAQAVVASRFTSENITTVASSPVIHHSYIGKQYGNQKGLFLGYFDLNADDDWQMLRNKDPNHKTLMKPVFAVMHLEPMTFDVAVETIAKLENGYQADPKAYDAMAGLRAGKIIIAPSDMLLAMHRNKTKGAFEKKISNLENVLSSSYDADEPDTGVLVNLRNGQFLYTPDRYFHPFTTLLVRAALNM